MRKLADGGPFSSCAKSPASALRQRQHNALLFSQKVRRQSAAVAPLAMQRRKLAKDITSFRCKVQFKFCLEKSDRNESLWQSLKLHWQPLILMHDSSWVLRFAFLSSSIQFSWSWIFIRLYEDILNYVFHFSVQQTRHWPEKKCTKIMGDANLTWPGVIK